MCLLGVDDDLIIDAFIEKSKFSELAYLVPLNEITFDDYDNLSEQEKQYHIVAKVLQRLYSYKYDEDFIGIEDKIYQIDKSAANEFDKRFPPKEIVDRKSVV